MCVRESLIMGGDTCEVHFGPKLQYLKHVIGIANLKCCHKYIQTRSWTSLPPLLARLNCNWIYGTRRT
jgi:hypothetical protein